MIATPSLPCIKNLTQTELSSHFVSMGTEAYRLKQFYKEFYQKSPLQFEQLSSIPKSLREQLKSEFSPTSMQLSKKTVSADGTIKFLFDLFAGGSVESVLIPSEMRNEEGLPKRKTLCISSQVGCQLGCKFCATASLKLQRSLSLGEILDQFFFAQTYSETPITNVVFMGMGEPMLNYDTVMRSVELLTDPTLELLSPKRITVSTAGVVPGIIKMADEQRQIKLALSLHATTNGLREKLMPISKKWNIQAVMDALEYYYQKTRIPVTFEYILFQGLNDSQEDIKRLTKLTRRFPSKVNIIPFHPIDFTVPTGFAATLQPTSDEAFKNFQQQLLQNDVTVMIRSSSGVDIDAACGQLAFSNAS